MKSKLLSFAIIMALASAMFCGTSCSNKEAEAERDSLIEQNKALNEFLNIVSISMDSINGQQQMLFVNRDGTPLTNMEAIRNNVKILKYTMDKQKERIADLENKLKNDVNKNDAQTQKLLAIINTLKADLAKKNQYIAELEEKLADKDCTIASLNGEIQKLNSQVTFYAKDNQEKTEKVNALTSENERQAEELKTSNEKVSKLSSGYVIMGTKDELNKAGVLKSGGAFNRRKADLSNVDVSKFQKISSTTTTINIPGKKPEIVTQHPASSYTLSGNTLTIKDPEEFWSSRYLIIRYK